MTTAMTRFARALAATSLLAAAGPASACGEYVDFAPLAAAAISPDETAARSAIDHLRAVGPRGLDAMLTAYASDLDASAFSAFLHPDPARLDRVRAAIDAVAAQKDAHVSRLYWYTDLGAAKAAAAASGRPILSLRLLGRLDEELSCANSRFFRTTLYANEAVANDLREGFVLHWETVRPVPVITIDFGHGRTIERTITGNSAHYALDDKGRVIDVLPGLHGPAAFRRFLAQAAADAPSLAARDDDRFVPALAALHARRLAALDSAWSSSRFEIAPEDAGDDVWARLAQHHADDASLDARSTQLIRTKHLGAREAGRLALSKMKIEDPMLAVLDDLRRSMAEETVRNEHLLHRRVHEWLAADATSALDASALNERVYAELFLMPSSDPWLGLVDEDAFTAIARK
jgi:hypothetical protein